MVRSVTAIAVAATRSAAVVAMAVVAMVVTVAAAADALVVAVVLPLRLRLLLRLRLRSQPSWNESNFPASRLALLARRGAKFEIKRSGLVRGPIFFCFPIARIVGIGQAAATLLQAPVVIGR